MELTVIFNAIVSLVSSGNYIGALFVILVIAGYMFWKKLAKIEKSQQPTHKKTDYNKFIEHDSIVMDELESIRKEHGADRAIVLELRNGEVNVANIPSMKMHVRNEKLKPMIFSTASMIDGVPVSFYSKALRMLVKDITYSLPDVEILKEDDFGLYQNLIASKVKSLYIVPLFDKTGVIYGALMLQYCDTKQFFKEEKIHEIEVDAARLNGKIQVMKKVENTYS